MTDHEVGLPDELRVARSVGQRGAPRGAPRASWSTFPRCSIVRSEAFTLVEVIIGLALVVLLAATTLPTFFRASSRLRVELAGQEIAGALRLARLYAIRHSANVAIKFSTHEDGQVTFALYRDADGDGVRNSDIASGVDPPVTAPKRLEHLGRAIGFGFPQREAPRHPSTGRRMDRLHDPIRFNRSDLASFSALGAATPGSVYISDQRANLVAVRVTSRTGRVRLLHYDYKSRQWTP